MYSRLMLVGLLVLLVFSEEELKLKIGLPEYICDKDGDIKDVASDMTTIRLLGSDAQSVNYFFDVNFERIGVNNCQNRQRCTLMVWKAVRELNTYLRDYPSERMLSGLIEVNNTMFLPGIKYILNVTVMKEGEIMEEKSLTMDYVDEEAKKIVTKPMASILLLGPDTTYAFNSYTINAESIICSNITNYYFVWELNDGDDTIVKFPQKGTILKIPPDILQAPKTYSIKCELIGDDLPIAESLQSLVVLSRGLLVVLPVKILSVATDHPVRIKVFVKDLDNNEEPFEINWSCVELENRKECDYRSDLGEFEMDSQFSNPGKYEISVKASKKGNSAEANVIVEVIDEVPSVEIEELKLPVNPCEELHIGALVFGLKTSCSLQWVSVEDNDYDFIDFISVPGNPGVTVNITLKEDLFLHELEEFSNGTIDIEHNLIIPPKQGSWRGLKGDTQYLFRLIIKCPIGEIDYEETSTETVTTITEIVITTNAAPIMQTLEVKPSSGIAFQTSFIFQTQKATDQESDRPILYKFGYLLDSRSIIFCYLGEVSNTKAVLPYSKEGIQTFLEACDNWNSCDRTLGPLITTTLPETSYKQNVFEKFLQTFSWEDYDRAFGEAFAVSYSYQTAEEAELEKEARDLLMVKIVEDLDRFLEAEEDDGNGWKAAANDLVRNVEVYDSYFKFPETIITKGNGLQNKLNA